MKVGLFLTNQHPLDSDLVEGQKGQLEMFRVARDAGWDSVFAGQHWLTENMAMPQPVPFLARMAAESDDMAVGLGVMLLTLFNPVDAAEVAASLDITTGGRFVFGVGLGYRDVENQAFGIEGGRVDRFVKNLAIVKALLSGESVTVDYPWCKLNNIKLSTPPVQRPRPAIWIAADADPAVLRAARLADSWMINPHATTSTIVRQLQMFRDERTKVGLEPVSEMPLMREVFCAPTQEEALRAALPYLESKYRAYASWGQDDALPETETFDIPVEELAQQRFVIGNPDQCLNELLPWRTHLGIDHFIFRTHWSGMPPSSTISSMKLLTDEVLPALREA
ncbi:MAG: LLM class flavin-dependent oxidoreductase [Acidimicrobiia bacterium]|nr:LLM class flavin-dependent oxidoreductase [Acidimicrobiia bacterium]